MDAIQPVIWCIQFLRLITYPDIIVVLHASYGEYILQEMIEILLRSNVSVAIYTNRYISNGDDLLALRLANEYRASIISNDTMTKPEDFANIADTDYVIYHPRIQYLYI